jgi:nitroreductase
LTRISTGKYKENYVYYTHGGKIIMTMQEAIKKRISRRNYTSEEIDTNTIETLDKRINEYNQNTGLHIQLIQNQPAIFSNLSKSYGMFNGVRNFFVMVGKKSDENAMEKIGYYGEKLVLEATLLGLGTCWVSGTYDKNAIQCKLFEDETIFCVITIGNIKHETGIKEKIIYKITHRKTKNIKEMYISDTNVPDWFISGIEAVQKAPSAMNRQPLIFSYINDRIFAKTEPQGHNIDLGIAKLHFEIGSGGGTWKWGTEGVFNKKI